MSGLQPALAPEGMISGEVLQQLEADLVRLARVDSATCVEYILRNERTGKPITLAPQHFAWHDLIDAKTRVVIWAHVEAGKSQQVSIGRVLYEIGRDPSIRVAIISNTHRQACKIVSSLKGYIEKSPEFRAVFPHVRPAAPWSADAFTVTRPTLAKDPTVQACGVHGALLGSRLDLVVLDDILDYENCKGPTQRDDLWDWLQSTMTGRMTDNARVVCIGTAFHPGDTMHRFAENPLWTAVHYPVLDPVTGEPRWPEQWPLKRIEERRIENGPIEFARQMLCQSRSDSEARFKREWIDLALKLGRGKQPCHALRSLPPGVRTFTGVDLAVSLKSSADMTVFFTIAIYPNGQREVLNIEASRIAGPDIIKKILEIHYRYNSIMVVENVAAQDYIVQFTQHVSAVPVVPFTTGSNKSDPAFGLESIAAEMAGGKWIIPSGDGSLDPEIEAWVNDMLYYVPTAHTPDRMMAAWFAREGSRMTRPKAEVGRFDLMAR